MILALGVITSGLTALRAQAQDSASATSGDFPQVVTIGVFQYDGTNYTRIENRDLVMEVGQPCFVWAREASGDDQVKGTHLHYNAADETSYVDGTFTWVEYGPEHSEEAIRKRCAAHENGTQPKRVNWTDYTPEQHGGRDPY